MLYFVVFREEGMWVAHGLQRNVVAFGPTIQAVRENIHLTLKAFNEQCQGSLEQLPMAEARYWEMFVAAIESGRTLDDNSDLEPDGSMAFKIAA